MNGLNRYSKFFGKLFSRVVKMITRLNLTFDVNKLVRVETNDSTNEF